MLDIGISRSTKNKWIFGVCGGIAEKFDVKPLWVRLGALAIAILPAGLGVFPMVLIYVVLTILLPKAAPDPLETIQY
jgi:phage shock protein C